MERVVGLAHGFTSPHLPPTVDPLPVAVAHEDLKQHVKCLSAADCTPPIAGAPPVFVRVDEELGLRIYAWCDNHDVAYGGYLRSVLRLAAGYRSADDLEPQHVQDPLPDVNTYRGERAKAS